QPRQACPQTRPTTREAPRRSELKCDPARDLVLLEVEAGEIRVAHDVDVLPADAEPGLDLVLEPPASGVEGVPAPGIQAVQLLLGRVVVDAARDPQVRGELAPDALLDAEGAAGRDVERDGPERRFLDAAVGDQRDRRAVGDPI